jgi:arabinan endo-1,5-alpha-L-arabinosidase
MKYLLLLMLVFILEKIKSQPIPAGTVLPVSQTPVHDPVLIKQDSIYYLFSTGFGITVWSSRDLKEWKKEKPVFEKAPEWAVRAIPAYKGHTWAPDINYHNGLYYLYYSVSAFGKNTSCIGVATTKSLHPFSKDYKWTDHGKVIQSVPGRDMWNAIDPNLAFDEKEVPWLVFGSFWNGIKICRLNNDLKSLAQPEEWFTVASRYRNPALPDSVAGDAAIEAPFIFKKDKYYYLFVSFDYCCRGEKSTYKIMVGRSEKLTGPYFDQEGVSMNSGGGSPLLKAEKNWFGAGHNAVLSIEGSDYLVFHGYDAHDKGKSKLRLEKIRWDRGWPVLDIK